MQRSPERSVTETPEMSGESPANETEPQFQKQAGPFSQETLGHSGHWALSQGWKERGKLFPKPSRAYAHKVLLLKIS